MEIGDLPHQREPQPRTAVLAAAGLIHTEKGLEDALLILLRNAAAGIGNANQEFFRFLCDTDPHRAAGAVVLNGVLCQVKDQPVDQRIAAGHNAVAIRLQRDAALFHQWRKIRKNLLNHGSKLDPLVPCHLPQIAHLQQRLGQPGQTFRLLS